MPVFGLIFFKRTIYMFAYNIHSHILKDDLEKSSRVIIVL